MDLKQLDQATSALWAQIPRRVRIFLIFWFVTITLYLAIPAIAATGVPLPRVRLEYALQPTFNASKLALLIENRPSPVLAPLMLHFLSVVPPDWRFRFMGSVESVAAINASVAVRAAVATGKLDLTYIPANMSTGSQEEISRFLTNLWVYETLLAPAEWLLIFQTDSMLCANARRDLNDYLEYDWVGAPWNASGRFGGNGGLSLRRVSAIVEILRNQIRLDGSEPEDVWLTDRLGHRPGARLANGSLSMSFSGESQAGRPVRILHHAKHRNAQNGTDDLLQEAREGAYVEGLDDWREGFYEPLGYHTGGSGRILPDGLWGTPRLRKHIWDYCPEIKMTLDMDAAQYVPGDCGAVWKRDSTWEETEVIDGVEYPVLPPGLAPWF
ncbi:hypothetical protein QBC47DRAFT_463788 [Echria macrotheca]|uniref:DUF5672 domain-containing protein n=1 Tax=Echria macrotheca TaxID=438768 RepID=A0AAJ0B7N7_9PEZI|nr:hypothetical protein QBC47DRAFT_463788 [Echria macrotheca]